MRLARPRIAPTTADSTPPAVLSLPLPAAADRERQRDLRHGCRSTAGIGLLPRPAFLPIGTGDVEADTERRRRASGRAPDCPTQEVARKTGAGFQDRPSRHE